METPVPVLQGARILVMEDEFLIAMALEAVLEDHGCVVVGPFATVRAGWDSADADGIDAAVLDVNLRDGIVSPIAARLQARGVPIMLHTSHDNAATLPDCLKTLPRLSKPSSDAGVARALATLLGV